MRLGSSFVFLAVFLGSSLARSADWSTADRARLKAAVEDAKEVLREISIDSEYARKLEFGLFSSAYAFDEEYNCFYAGWPSKLSPPGSGRRLCTRPMGLDHYTRLASKTSCGGNEMVCNPLLFGDGICTPMGQTAFSQCEVKFNARPDKYKFIDDLTKDAVALAELKQILDLANDICGPEKPGVQLVATQRNTPMCARFLRRREAIMPKLNQSTHAAAELKPVGVLPKTIIAKKDLNEGNEHLVSGATTQKAGNECATDCMDPTVVKKTEAIQIKNIVDAHHASENWLTSKKDPKLMYQEIKNKYLSSGKCNRQAALPEPEQAMFDLKLFNRELSAFSMDLDPKERTTESEAISSLGDALGWTDVEKTNKMVEVRAFPKETYGGFGSYTPAASRTQFQLKLARELVSMRNQSPLKEKIAERSKKLFEEKQISNCDFINEPAFVEAVNAARTSKFKAKGSDLLTITDRSLPKTSRRMITLNMKTGDVLFHADAKFGDGNPATTAGPEKDVCRNTSQSNNSPYGLGFTTKRKYLVESQNPKSKIPPIEGTFLVMESESRTNLQDRRIAFHRVGRDVLGRFYDEEDPISKTYQKASTTRSSKDVVQLLREGRDLVNPNAGGKFATDGCVGIPTERAEAFHDLIEGAGGSFVYFYCKDDMRR